MMKFQLQINSKAFLLLNLFLKMNFLWKYLLFQIYYCSLIFQNYLLNSRKLVYLNMDYLLKNVHYINFLKMFNQLSLIDSEILNLFIIRFHFSLDFQIILIYYFIDLISRNRNTPNQSSDPVYIYSL